MPLFLYGLFGIHVQVNEHQCDQRLVSPHFDKEVESLFFSELLRLLLMLRLFLELTLFFFGYNWFASGGEEGLLGLLLFSLLRRLCLLHRLRNGLLQCRPLLLFSNPI